MQRILKMLFKRWFDKRVLFTGSGGLKFLSSDKSKYYFSMEFSAVKEFDIIVYTGYAKKTDSNESLNDYQKQEVIAELKKELKKL